VSARTILGPISSRTSSGTHPTGLAGARRGVMAALAIVAATIAFLGAVDYTWSTLLTVLGTLIRSAVRF
jgi:hypothetical protein